MWRHSWCQSECCVVLSLEPRSSRQCLGSICRKCLPGPLSWRWDVAPVLCITWTLTQPRVTTSARVLKTTRLPCFNRSCCEIRVFHPYLMARSPRLTDSPWPRRWGWQRSDESFVTLRDSFLCPRLKCLIDYSFVLSWGLSTLGRRYQVQGLERRFLLLSANINLHGLGGGFSIYSYFSPSTGEGKRQAAGGC